MHRLLPLAAVFVACTPSGIDQDEADELSETATQDVDDLLRTAESQAAGAGDLGTTKVSDQMCFDTVGDCEVCVSYAGTASAGAFGASMTTTPCGATWTLVQRTRTYTVDASDIDGTWTRQKGTQYLVEVTGEREVSYEVTGGREGDRSYDASWTLHDLSVTTEADELVGYDLDLEYTGFAGHDSRLVVSGDADSGGGTLTVDGDQVCSVERTGDTVTVDCSGS